MFIFIVSFSSMEINLTNGYVVKPKENDCHKNENDIQKYSHNRHIICVFRKKMKD